MRFALAVERVIDGLISTALVVMVAAMFWQVFGRYVLGRAPSWSEELARFLMVWMTMLGSASVVRGGGHISVTAFADTLRPVALKVLLAVRDLCVVAAMGVLAWMGMKFAHLNAAQESAAMEIPMTIPYAALPIGACLIGLQVVLARLLREPFPATPGEQF